MKTPSNYYCTVRRPYCVGSRVTELTEATQLSRPAVSHHLKILKQAKLIDCRSEGTKIITHFLTIPPKLSNSNNY